METICKLQAAGGKPWRDSSGFTLAEALITVAIIAILATVALPQYGKAVERNYRQQAQDILTTIYYGERAYRLANAKFVTVPGPAAWTDIFLDDPHVAGNPITFAVTTATNDTFNATATRAAGTGVCASKFLQIDENRTITGDWVGCP